jgi:hypothetical protein
MSFIIYPIAKGSCLKLFIREILVKRLCLSGEEFTDFLCDIQIAIKINTTT